jgi:chitinase
MAGTYFGPVPPPIPYGSHPQLNTLRRPSQPSLEASISDLTRKNAVYYPNYRVYRDETPATLNYNCISHVFYAFANVGPDGFVSVICSCKHPNLELTLPPAQRRVGRLSEAR